MICHYMHNMQDMYNMQDMQHPQFNMLHMHNMTKNMSHIDTPPFFLKNTKNKLNMHLKTGLTAGGRPVLRFFY